MRIVKPKLNKLFVDQDVVLHTKELAERFDVTFEDVLFILVKEYARNPRVLKPKKRVPVKLYSTEEMDKKVRELKKKLGTDFSGVFRLLLDAYKHNIVSYLEGKNSYINTTKFKS